MIKTKKNGIALLLDYLLRNGWEKDKYGHFKKDNYRMKMQSNSVREEYKNGLGKWIRTRSGYYSQLSIDVYGKLDGLSMK